MTAHVVNIHGANGQPVAKIIPLPPARQPGAWAGMTRTVADDVGPDGDIEAEFSESVNQAET